MDTEATFYGGNFKIDKFSCKKYKLCRIHLDIRICNKKGGTILVLPRKMFQIGLRHDFVKKKKSFSFSIGEQKYFRLLTLALHIVTPKKISLFDKKNVFF